MIFALLSTRHRGFAVLVILVLFLICQIALISCNPINFKSKAAQVSQWITSTIGDPKTFNYAFNQEYPHVFLFMTEGLTTLNGITGKIEPALAESWDISDDQKRVTFTLRENLKCSYGEPLTVDDVIFTYEDVIFNPLSSRKRSQS